MKRPLLSFLLLPFFLICLSSAETPNPADQLKLIPQPKEVQLHSGSFRVKPTTRILVEFGHQAEDRIAAETLAEEIRDQSGLKLSITGEKSDAKRKPSTIVLARLQDDRIKKFLASKGLKADSIGDQGYLLYSDPLHLIVAANTGQGLFYGVQTLRQLLRADGHTLICPAVSIRDWPSMEWRGMQDDISRGPIPTEDYMKQQIRMLAAYKVNLFALYMEHVFDFASQPLVAPKEAALTPQEINQSGRLREKTLRHDPSRAADVRASPQYAEVRDLLRCRGAAARSRAHADQAAVLRNYQSHVCGSGAAVSRTIPPHWRRRNV